MLHQSLVEEEDTTKYFVNEKLKSDFHFIRTRTIDIEAQHT